MLFLRLLEITENDANTYIVPASTELRKKGVALYASRADKNWSLTDCISFVVMEEYGLTDALTSDHHFAQAGFRVLLKG